MLKFGFAVEAFRLIDKLFIFTKIFMALPNFFCMVTLINNAKKQKTTKKTKF